MTGSMEVLERLRRFILENGLPRKDMALFGVKCPYCGKSDRIRKLETPEELGKSLSDERLDVYRDLLATLLRGPVSLGVCKFCQSPLRLSPGCPDAEPLLDSEE